MNLTKLSDQELADRLTANWAAYEATGLPPPGRSRINLPLLFTLRGPVRNRLAFFGLLGLGGVWGELAFRFFGLLHFIRRRFLRKDPATDAHIILCEISDIMGELEYRVGQQRKKR